MKAAKVVGRHSRECWYRNDDTDPHGWFFDIYRAGAIEVDGTGYRHDFAYLTCNSPGCPARLRVTVRALEDAAVGLLADEELREEARHGS